MGARHKSNKRRKRWVWYTVKAESLICGPHTHNWRTALPKIFQECNDRKSELKPNGVLGLPKIKRHFVLVHQMMLHAPPLQQTLITPQNLNDTQKCVWLRQTKEGLLTYRKNTF